MIYTIITFLALAVIIGMILLSYVLRDKETPKSMMVVHGLLAVTGLILLIKYTFERQPGPVESLILFGIAALGGIILAIRDISGKKVPKWLGIVHGLTAVTGFIILLVFAFG